MRYCGRFGRVIALVLAAAAAGCGGGSGMDGDAADGDGVDGDTQPVACWDDLQPGERVALTDRLDNGSEGIAFDAAGRLFVGSNGQAVRVGADGSLEVAADIPHAVGIAFDAAGNLVAASFGESFQTEPIDGAVYRMAPGGSPEKLLDGTIANPNFVTRTPWGTWLVSDDMTPEIWEVDDAGSASLWTDQIPSPNGMVFSADGSALYVCDTFVDGGPVWRIPVSGQAAGTAEVHADFAEKSLNDGIALGADGSLYVAANRTGTIWRIGQDGAFEKVAEGLLTPASIAFGVGPDFDPCSIYVTELLFEHVWRIALGRPGQPLYR